MQRTSTETGGSGGSPESSADMLRFEDDVCRSKPASQSSGLHSFIPDPVSDLVDDRTLLEDGGSSGLVTLLARVLHTTGARMEMRVVSRTCESAVLRKGD
ncbi:hypothetical protein Bca4012_013037 [Brassica carinata]